MDVTTMSSLGRWPCPAASAIPGRASTASWPRRPSETQWALGGTRTVAARASPVADGEANGELERRWVAPEDEEEEAAVCSRESPSYSGGLTRRRNAWSRQLELARSRIRVASNPAEERSRSTVPLWVKFGQRRDELGRKSGRRAFSWSGVLGLVALSFAAGSGPVRAAEAPARKPAKIKGRPPSSPYDEDRLLEQNRRMQKLNNAPGEFPGFVREGFQVKVIISDKYVTSRSGLIYYDMVVGDGDLPQDGQQVIFHYTGYNESGRRVDSSYQQGRPARTRLGIQGMIPGFEEGIKSMRAGGRRIIVVPPELGPPVGPSTFFSAKQFEVFDVELLESKNCNRRTLLFYSDVVCD